MHKELYSVRMRASLNSRHISGAERIVAKERIADVVRELSSRALNKTAAPDRIAVSVESLRGLPVRELTALDVVTLDVPDAGKGRSTAVRVLRKTGVSEHAARTAVDLLVKGAAPSGGTMRGAVIMDSESGERLEPDQERGVRASRFDWTDDALERIIRRLAAAGLKHFRTREALALATKVANGPGVLAELCWSDEPDYTAGYVASLKTGYVRLPHLKETGDPKGGRVFFVGRDTLKLDVLMRYLQMEAVMIYCVGKCSKIMKPEEYFSQPSGTIEMP